MTETKTTWAEQYDLNVKAIAAFEEKYGNVRRAFEDDQGSITDRWNYLRSIKGLKCVGCGGGITYGNFRFNEYMPNSFCYSCQSSK